jgi:5-methyltetrahydrofolate--homocysteine methyltransferase
LEALPGEVEVAEGKADRRAELRAATRAAKAGGEAPAGRSAVPVLESVPAAPFLGVRLLGPEEISLEEVYDCFDLRSLFRLSWGVPSEREAEFRGALERWRREARERRLIVPRIAYGYFRCRAEGDALVVEGARADAGSDTGTGAGTGTGTGAGGETRFLFPRQPGGERLCLADYFRSAEAGGDVVALTCVTAGPEASAEGERLQHEGKFSDAHQLHGFATQAAEALAEWLHRRIRRELGVGPKVGQRFSFGYPACPDLEPQEPLCRLLGAERIGVSLTSAFQLVPEQSTTALVVHHPAAKYFAAAPAGAAAAEALLSGR